jgi:hypothetical protein
MSQKTTNKEFSLGQLRAFCECVLLPPSLPNCNRRIAILCNPRNLTRQTNPLRIASVIGGPEGWIVVHPVNLLLHRKLPNPTREP